MVEIDAALAFLYGETMLHLGALQGVTSWFDTIGFLKKAYMYKEALAVLSDEGSEITREDLFLQQVVEEKDSDMQDVLAYLKVLQKAYSMAAMGKAPRSSLGEVVSELYGELVGGGDTVEPGVCGDMYKDMPPVIMSGLLLAHFETNFPCPNNNGKIGRLLISFLLAESGILPESLLYPSEYFQKRFFDYNMLLDEVQAEGDYKKWIMFYLLVMRDSAVDAYKRAKAIKALEEKMVVNVMDDKKIGKGYESRLDAVPVLFHYPILTMKVLSTQNNITFTTASKVMDDFVRLGFLEVDDSNKQQRLFHFRPYLEILEG